MGLIMTNRLLFLLSRAEHALSQQLKIKLQQGGLSLTPGQMGILFLLKQKNLRTMSDLSTNLHIDNSAITRLVDRLEKNNLVERVANNDDRRQNLISATQKGIIEISSAQGIVKDINNLIKEDFSDKEIEIFTRIILNLITKLNGENNE
jgi:DNA-binding MarR family transcriptional regulator